MTSYEATIEKHRKNRDARTASDPLHWLNLEGLFWLEEGENSFGSREDCKISLPEFPEKLCGIFQLTNGVVTLHPSKGAEITVSGKKANSKPLKSDTENDPDLIQVGPLTMKIIIRGGQSLVRIWNRESQAIKDFAGFHYYPIKPEYRVTGKYIHYDPPKPIKVTEVIGTEVDSVLLGKAVFTLNGVECALEAEKSGDKILFNFTDGTNKETTYGGGRKFYMPEPEGDEIILDFNLTENWPCAYTPYATCPLPLKENRLPIKIEAGELKYHD